MTTNEKINKLLGNRRIPAHEFADLKIVVDDCGGASWPKLEKIFRWFRFLQSKEIVGWRPKAMTKKIAGLLKSNSSENTLTLYALFCPSYKKGKDAFGFRTDAIGSTTLAGIKNLDSFHRQTKELGFEVEDPLAVFFDLAIEQHNRVVSNNALADIEENIKNLKHHLPSHFRFIKLSDYDILKQKIGYKGIRLSKLPIPEKTFERIIERGYKFYKLFGWTTEQVRERSLTIACSEALVGDFLRQGLPRGIMIYTPTMLERGAVYSGMKFDSDPLPIILPKKGL